MQSPRRPGVGITGTATKSLCGDVLRPTDTAPGMQRRSRLALRIDRIADALVLEGRHAIVERLSHYAAESTTRVDIDRALPPIGKRRQPPAALWHLAASLARPVARGWLTLTDDASVLILEACRQSGDLDPIDVARGLQRRLRQHLDAETTRRASIERHTVQALCPRVVAAQGDPWLLQSSGQRRLRGARRSTPEDAPRRRASE
jgi:hypothetical protein